MHSDLSNKTKAIRFLIDQTRWQAERGDLDRAQRTLKLTKRVLFRTAQENPEEFRELIPLAKTVQALETMNPQIFALGFLGAGADSWLFSKATPMTRQRLEKDLPQFNPPPGPPPPGNVWVYAFDTWTAEPESWHSDYSQENLYGFGAVMDPNPLWTSNDYAFEAKKTIQRILTAMVDPSGETGGQTVDELLTRGNQMSLIAVATAKDRGEKEEAAEARNAFRVFAMAYTRSYH